MLGFSFCFKSVTIVKEYLSANSDTKVVNIYIKKKKAKESLVLTRVLVPSTAK